MNKFLIVMAFLALLFVFYLALQGHYSRKGSAAGLDAGRLKPCPDRPNCVCSEYPRDQDALVAPLELAGRPGADELLRLTRILVALGGRVETTREDYTAATFTSRLFGFVDDVELRHDPGENLIHIRSASRVGYSDLDANRERVDKIRQQFIADRNDG